MKTLHILKGGLILSSFEVYFLILFTSSFLLISVQFIWFILCISNYFLARLTNVLFTNLDNFYTNELSIT